MSQIEKHGKVILASPGNCPTRLGTTGLNDRKLVHHTWDTSENVYLWRDVKDEVKSVKENNCSASRIFMKCLCECASSSVDHLQKHTLGCEREWATKWASLCLVSNF